MTTIQTIHPDNDRTVRRVTLEDGADVDFDVDDSGDVPSHEYRGEGEPPLEAKAALSDWMEEYHGAGYTDLEELEDAGDQEGDVDEDVQEDGAEEIDHVTQAVDEPEGPDSSA